MKSTQTRSQRLPAERLMGPLWQFTQKEASAGILLLFCTVAALIWANSPWAESYFHLWETPLQIGIGRFQIREPLHLWINDALMAVFFFVVGLEIKREILVGDLSTPKQAMLPIAAAFGGMVVPAAFYLLLNNGTPEARGWGIPMATDIAFAIGVLSLLGKRVPTALKVFLTALAIVDDIGAVLVIAFFYTLSVQWWDLAMGGFFLLTMWIGNWMGVRTPIFYAVLGIGGLWTAFFLSGVHATVAGVLAAFAIPARTRINADEFMEEGRSYLSDFESAAQPGNDVLSNKQQLHAINRLSETCEEAQTPLQKLEHRLHPWVSFLIMPLFAFANAGVSLGEGFLESLRHPVSLGILLGLFLGKQTGIFFFSWLVVQLRLASLPARVSWGQVYGVSLLGGIGFTMSLFIANLAFEGGPALALSKVGILVASLAAGIVGLLYLRITIPKAEKT